MPSISTLVAETFGFATGLAFGASRLVAPCVIYFRSCAFAARGQSSGINRFKNPDNILEVILNNRTCARGLPSKRVGPVSI